MSDMYIGNCVRELNDTIRRIEKLLDQLVKVEQNKLYEMKKPTYIPPLQPQYMPAAPQQNDGWVTAPPGYVGDWIPYREK